MGTELFVGHEVRQTQGEDRPRAFDRQLQPRAAAVEMKKPGDASQRCVHIRRVLREQTDEPERVQPGMPADQQAEVRAAGPDRPMGEQAAARRLRDAVVRAVEQRGIEPQLGEHCGRIGTEATQNFGNREHGTDADGGLLSGDARCRPYPLGCR